MPATEQTTPKTTFHSSTLQWLVCTLLLHSLLATETPLQLTNHTPKHQTHQHKQPLILHTFIQAIQHPDPSTRHTAWTQHMPRLWHIHPHNQIITHWKEAATNTFWYIKESAWQEGFATLCPLLENTNHTDNPITLWQYPQTHPSLYVQKYAWTLGLATLADALSPPQKQTHFSTLFDHWQQATKHPSFIIREDLWYQAIPTLCHTFPQQLAAPHTSASLLNAWQQATQDSDYSVCKAAWVQALPALWATAFHNLPKTLFATWHKAIKHPSINAREAAWQYGLSILATLAPHHAKQHIDSLWQSWKHSFYHPDTAKATWWAFPTLCQISSTHLLNHRNELFSLWTQSLHHPNKHVQTAAQEAIANKHVRTLLKKIHSPATQPPRDHTTHPLTLNNIQPYITLSSLANPLVLLIISIAAFLFLKKYHRIISHLAPMCNQYC